MQSDRDNWIYDAEKKQYYRYPPPSIGSAMNKLLARKGYARVLAADNREEVWRQAVGKRFAGHTRPGNTKRGVLEVFVRNSAVMQELAFSKRQILKKLQKLGGDVKDIKFRVGAID